jgi:Lrp/AsnC family transcriptional regulator for asnA, asnC and gidA
MSSGNWQYISKFDIYFHFIFDINKLSRNLFWIIEILSLFFLLKGDRFRLGTIRRPSRLQGTARRQTADCAQSQDAMSTPTRARRKPKDNGQVRRKPIDRIDCRMIELLQRDGRLSNTDIAKQIGISEATVRSRLHRLIKEEYIQIVAVSNPIKLGFQIVGTIRIHVDVRKMDQVTTALKQLKPLWFIVHTTGGSDIVTEFVVESMEELNQLILKKINKIDGIHGTDTSLFLKYVKRQYDWGTAGQ